jgi:hypothetical protein
MGRMGRGGLCLKEEGMGGLFEMVGSKFVHCCNICITCSNQNLPLE